MTRSARATLRITPVRRAAALLAASCAACAGSGGTSRPDLALDAPLVFHDAGVGDGEAGTGEGGGSEGGSADLSPDAARTAWTHDLDRDGTRDSTLVASVCAQPAAPAALCLDVRSTLFASPRQIVVAVAGEAVKAVAAGNVLGEPLVVLGNHLGGTLSEVSLLFVLDSGRPALAVIDVEASKVVALTVAPAGQTTSYSDYPKDPLSRRHPFLAPSYGDTPGATLWGYLCLFRPAASAQGRCGGGFVEISSAPTTAIGNPGYFFREVGGYLQDLDGDGWEDINLIYHATVLAISTQTGKPLATTSYDVAATSEPGSPKWFHSGRNYGTHSAFSAADGQQKTVIVGGIPVGSFKDVNCNVSRFVAVLSSPKGQPKSRVLAWARYYGFTSTIFSAYDPKYAANPPVARAADILDNCIHRFGDSRAVMDGQEVVVFNYFASAAPIDRCIDEQYALYLPPTWTAAKSKAWYDCLGKNLAVEGVWGLQVLRTSDGLPLTGSQQTYVWGTSNALLPKTEQVYLVESLPAKTPYDLDKTTAGKISVRALVNGLWTARGSFPTAGRPKLRFEAAEGPRGVGSYTAFAELTLKDVDGDGLADVQLADGSWVGYSQVAQDFALKTP